MATKYDPEKDYAKYLELAKKQEELDGRIAALLEEQQKLKSKIAKHLEAARKAVGFELIKAAAHEFQVEILNDITRAVIEANDLEKAVRLIDHLETHLEARLRLSFGQKPKEEAPPSVSPAIAAKKAAVPAEKQVAAATQPKSTQRPIGATPPPISTKGGRITERRALLGDSLNEVCRYEYDGDRLARMVFLDAEGNPLRTHQLIYDREGTLVQEIHIDRAGVTLEVCSRELDRDGRILKETMSNAHNEVLHTIEFKYDRRGRLQKKQWRDARGRKTKSWDYRYKKGAQEPTRIIWRDERRRPYVFVELYYDDKGHIIKEISKDRSGDVIRAITYQYFYG